jgi:hypothetical protein
MIQVVGEYYLIVAKATMKRIKDKDMGCKKE